MPVKATTTAAHSAPDSTGFDRVYSTGFDQRATRARPIRTLRSRNPKVSKGLRAPARARTRDWAPVFLASLARTGSVRASARAAGVGRRTVYDRRERDLEFAAAWDAAFELGRTERQVYGDRDFCPRCGRSRPRR